MSPRSRSRSVSQRRSYTKSPARRSNGRRRRSKEKSFNSRSRSPTRHPPSPPPLPPTGRGGRFSDASKSSSTSLSPRHGRRISHSRTHSPYDKRRANREQPVQNRCIGVFGLSVYTTQQKIREIFSRFGPIERIQVVIDAQTGRSRGFCFIYYEDIGDAKAAKDACSGMEIDDRRIRVDYSTTQRPHTPTPGVYMGRHTRREREHHDRYRDDYRPRRRSASPYNNRNNYRNDRRRRYDRSRSRSYSPRRTRY